MRKLSTEDISSVVFFSVAVHEFLSYFLMEYACENYYRYVINSQWKVTKQVNSNYRGTKKWSAATCNDSF